MDGGGPQFTQKEFDMEKLIKAALIAWNPFLEVKKRMVEGKLGMENVLVPFVTVIIASKLVEFEAWRYWFEVVMQAAGSPEVNIPPILSNKFAQQFLAVFGTLFPIGTIFLLPNSNYYPHKASAIGASILIITSSFTFYGSTIAAAGYVLTGTMIQVNPYMGQNFLWLSVAASIAIVPVAIWLWCKILLSVLGLSKSAFSLITASYFLGIGILVAIFSLGAS